MPLSDVHPVVAAKRKLVELVGAEAGGKVDVLYGHISAKAARARRVSVSGGRAVVDPEYLGPGRGADVERWAIRVTCGSAAGHRDYEEAETSALRLANTVEDVVAANRTLDGLVEHAQVASFELADAPPTEMSALVDMIVELWIEVR